MNNELNINNNNNDNNNNENQNISTSNNESIIESNNKNNNNNENNENNENNNENDSLSQKQKLSIFSIPRRSSILNLLESQNMQYRNSKRKATRKFKKPRLMPVITKAMKRHKPIIFSAPKTEIEADIIILASQLERNSRKRENVPEKKFLTYIKYILSKNIYNQWDLIVLRNYLLNFPGLINTFNFNKSNTTTEEILHKLSLFMQLEKFEPNSIVCLNGEIGDKFYLILKGKVAVLVPTKFSDSLTEKEYVKHLYNLYALKEYDIMLRTIEDNYDKFNNNDVVNLAKENYELINLNTKENVSVEDYIERVKPIYDDDEYYESEEENEKKKKFVIDSKKNVVIWGYSKVVELEAGKIFGDVALSNSVIHRTATIITVDNNNNYYNKNKKKKKVNNNNNNYYEDNDDDIYFGTLQKNIYQICIKSLQEVKRKSNIEKILSQKMFVNFKYEDFEKNYFNYFKQYKFLKDELIFKAGDEPKEVFFLYEGEIELNCVCSLNKLNQFSNKLKNNIKNNNNNNNNDNSNIKIEKNETKEDKIINKLNMLHKTLNAFYNAKKEYKLFVYKDRDVVGLNDTYFLDDNKKSYFCNCVVKSEVCYFFAVDFKYFKRIINEDFQIKKDYKNCLEEKNILMMKRLSDLENKIYFKNYHTFIDIIENDDTNNNTVNDDNNNNNNRLFKPNLTMYKKFKINKRNINNSDYCYTHNKNTFSTIEFKNKNHFTYNTNLTENSTKVFTENHERLKTSFNITNYNNNNNNNLNNNVNINNNLNINNRNGKKINEIKKLFYSQNIPLHYSLINEHKIKKKFIDKIIENNNNNNNNNNNKIYDCLTIDNFFNKIKNKINNVNKNHNNFSFNSNMINMKGAKIITKKKKIKLMNNNINL